MKTIEIDISNHDTGKFEIDIPHIIGGFLVLMVSMGIGIFLSHQPPAFGVPLIDLYMGAWVVAAFVAFSLAMLKVTRIANRDKKAHAEFLTKVKQVSGLSFKNESALVVNNVGYTGLPAKVLMTDGVKESVWAPSIEGDTLKLVPA